MLGGAQALAGARGQTRADREAGVSVSEIARQLGVGRASGQANLRAARTEAQIPEPQS